MPNYSWAAWISIISLFSSFFLAVFGSYDSIVQKSRFDSYQMATWAVQFRSCSYLSQMMLFDIICVKLFNRFEKVSIIFSRVLNPFPLSSAKNDANFSCYSLVNVILFEFFNDVGHIKNSDVEALDSISFIRANMKQIMHILFFFIEWSSH